MEEEIKQSREATKATEEARKKIEDAVEEAQKFHKASGESTISTSAEAYTAIIVFGTMTSAAIILKILWG